MRFYDTIHKVFCTEHRSEYTLCYNLAYYGYMYQSACSRLVGWLRQFVKASDVGNDSGRLCRFGTSGGEVYSTLTAGEALDAGLEIGRMQYLQGAPPEDAVLLRGAWRF